MSNIKKKIKIRQGHRAYLTKILGNADDNVQNYDGNQEKKLKQIRITLKERLDTKISRECSRNDCKYRQFARGQTDE
jgi:hypothetical protein